jgi:protein-disulfide isomerase
MSRKVIIPVIAIMAIAAIGYFVISKDSVTNPSSASSIVASDVANAPVEQNEEAITTTEEVVTSSDAGTQVAAVTIDVDAALAERTLGKADAPVTIEEFASLTCGHCANFNATTMKDIKKNLVDKGKVKFVYTDFPLNAPALDAAMIARCLPEQHYFKFLDVLFDKQNDWAYQEDYRTNLRGYAALLGMSTATFDACISNEKLREGLLARMKDKADKHQINSTPSVVINNGETIRGGASYEVIKTKVEALSDAQ